MINKGQLYNIDGTKLYVMETIAYNNKNYALMYLEDKNVRFKFYEIIDTGIGYDLTEVEDIKTLEYLTANSKSIKTAMDKASLY